MNHHRLKQKPAGYIRLPVTLAILLMAVINLTACERYYFKQDIYGVWKTESISVEGNCVRIKGSAADTDDYHVRIIDMEDIGGIVTLHVYGVSRKYSDREDPGVLSMDAEYFFDEPVIRVQTADGQVLWSAAEVDAP